MPWIRMNEEFPEDPRLDRVARALGKPHEVAALTVLRLWCWAAKHLEDGVLDGVDPAALARRLAWRGDPSKLMLALEGEFVQTGKILDWEEVSGRLLIARKREAYRSSRRRQLASSDRVVDQQTVGRSTAIKKEKEKKKEQDLSQTLLIVPPENGAGTIELVSPASKYSKRFETWWKNYPRHRRVGKVAAYRAWKRAAAANGGEEALYEALKLALPWQRSSEPWTKDGGQFVPHPATYLNQGRWQDERPEQ